MSSQELAILERILSGMEALAENIPSQPKRPIWPHYLGFTILLIGVFAGCAAYTKAQATESAAAIQRIEAEAKASKAKAEAMHQRVLAEIHELRRTIAMQREDPKAFPRLDEQFKAIEEYENGKNNRRNPD